MVCPVGMGQSAQPVAQVSQVLGVSEVNLVCLVPPVLQDHQMGWPVHQGPPAHHLEVSMT